MKNYSLILLVRILVIGLSFSSSVYGQGGQNDISINTSKNANLIVYHLTNDDP